MKLEDIGFYTLSDQRAESLSVISPMSRCEMILTDRCNFKCPYCRGMRPDCRGTMPFNTASAVLQQWLDQGLEHIRFSGGEPTLYPWLDDLVKMAEPCKRIAISTNGSASLERYLELMELGVDDFSISFDTCCSVKCGTMTGARNQFENLVYNIRELAKVTYVTLGVVLTDENVNQLANTVEYADDMGVADIRIIPAAQEGSVVRGVSSINPDILERHPILKYRVNNTLQGVPVRSIQWYDSHRCYMPVDDSVVAGDYHFPCDIPEGAGRPHWGYRGQHARGTYQVVGDSRYVS